MRALAVVLVVLYHLWPATISGGFIGVDVFFVISGFLITSHILSEVTRTGHISLPMFWARRAKRLLPASLTVVAVVAAVTILFVPSTFWRQYFEEITASAAYAQNWLLSSNAVDYLAAQHSASPVQHFWSLSVEEQFYLLWPVALLAVALATRGRSPQTRRVALIALIFIVTLASFLLSVVWTRALPAEAYFVTPTRVWEFGLGALLVFAPNTVLVGRPGYRSALSWAGLAAIVISAVVYSGDLAFPGYIALVPVAGAMAVLTAGDPLSKWSPARLMMVRPVQFLGDVSYSLYLWHFPPIVLLPIVRRSPLTDLDRVVILIAAVGVSWMTKVWIEDRFRVLRSGSRGRLRWVFLPALATSVAIVLASSVALSILDKRNERDAARVLAATTGSCFGASAIDDPSCPDPFADTGAMTPVFAQSDTSFVEDPDGGWQCQTPQGEEKMRRCVLGAQVEPDRTIAILGDSHAMHFLVALTAIAEERNWQVVTYFKSACSGTGAADVVLVARPDDQGPCERWGLAALASIVDDASIDTVVFSNAQSAYSEDDGRRPISSARYEATFKQMTDAGKKVLVLADVPRTLVDGPICLSTATGDASECDTPFAVAMPGDSAADAARDTSNESVKLLDLTERFCRDGICHARVGGVIVFSDAGHITNTYARSLAPYIEAALVDF